MGTPDKCYIILAGATVLSGGLNWELQARLFRGFDEDFVNDEEHALSASFSKSHNLEDMTQFPSNFSVIKIY